MEIILKQNEISFDSIREFQIKYDHIIDELTQDLVLNFKDINFIDSSAIGAIISMHVKLKAKGLKLYVKNINKVITSVFKIGGLFNILNVI